VSAENLGSVERIAFRSSTCGEATGLVSAFWTSITRTPLEPAGTYWVRALPAEPPPRILHEVEAASANTDKATASDRPRAFCDKVVLLDGSVEFFPPASTRASRPAPWVTPNLFATRAKRRHHPGQENPCQAAVRLGRHVPAPERSSPQAQGESS